MKLIQTLALASSLLVAVGTHAEAQNRNNRNNNNYNQRALEEARKKKAERDKKRAQSKKNHEAVKKYLETYDTNKDKSISRDEFLAAAHDKARAESEFDKFNKNKDRYLSRKEIEAMLGL
jgi:DNA replication protein DnaC